MIYIMYMYDIDIDSDSHFYCNKLPIIETKGNSLVFVITYL